MILNTLLQFLFEQRKRNLIECIDHTTNCIPFEYTQFQSEILYFNPSKAVSHMMHQLIKRKMFNTIDQTKYKRDYRCNLFHLIESIEHFSDFPVAWFVWVDDAFENAFNLFISKWIAAHYSWRDDRQQHNKNLAEDLHFYFDNILTMELGGYVPFCIELEKRMMKPLWMHEI